MTKPATHSPDISTVAIQNYDAALVRIERFDRGHNGLNAMSAIAAPPVARSGPLGGLTLALKDNIDVAGLPTTAGSHALLNAFPRSNAPIVDTLLSAGATLVGKTNQLELSGWVTFDSPSGFSELGGRALNPHDPRLSTGGSSSGAAVAVAARYVDAAIGTDTGGSVLNPAGLNGLFGLRPTVGRLPTVGIVPVTPHQDTPGPIARSVVTLARLYSALTCADSVPELYTGRLEGAVIGVPLLDTASNEVLTHFRERLNELRQRGAILVPILERLRWRGHGDLTVPAYDFRESIDVYLRGIDAPSGVRDFDSLLEHYLSDLPSRAPYGAANLMRSSRIDLERDRRLRDAVWRREHTHAREMLDRLRERQGVCAVIFPNGGAAYASSKSGYPALTLPGRIYDGTRMDFTSIVATAPDAEQTLLDIAFDIEENVAGAPPARLPATPHPSPLPFPHLEDAPCDV